jgi:hypothetical protein
MTMRYFLSKAIPPSGGGASRSGQRASRKSTGREPPVCRLSPRLTRRPRALQKTFGTSQALLSNASAICSLHLR